MKHHRTPPALLCCSQVSHPDPGHRIVNMTTSQPLCPARTRHPFSKRRSKPVYKAPLLNSPLLQLPPSSIFRNPIQTPHLPPKKAEPNLQHSIPTNQPTNRPKNANQPRAHPQTQQQNDSDRATQNSGRMGRLQRGSGHVPRSGAALSAMRGREIELERDVRGMWGVG